MLAPFLFMFPNSPTFSLRCKDWNDIQQSGCKSINVCYRNKQMTLSSVTFLMKTNFFLASQMSLHWADDFRELPTLTPRFCSWDDTANSVLFLLSTILHWYLSHPWGLSTVPCPRTQHLTTRKELSITCKLEGFTIASPFLSHLKGGRIELFPAPAYEGGTPSSCFFPFWNQHLSTTFCFLCFN